MKKLLLLSFLLFVASPVFCQDAQARKKLLDESVNTVCGCVRKKSGTEADFKSCVSEEIPKHKEALGMAYGDYMYPGISRYVSDLTFQCIDQCPEIASVLYKGRATSYKQVQDKCGKAIVGTYAYDINGPLKTIAYARFTSNQYQELDDKGEHVRESSPLSWRDCQGSVIQQTDGLFTKKGDVMKLTICRIGPGGFLAVMILDGVDTIVEYRRK